MRQERLRPCQKQRFRPRTTESRHDHPIAENWLAKPFADHFPHKPSIPTIQINLSSFSGTHHKSTAFEQSHLTFDDSTRHFAPGSNQKSRTDVVP
jgi:hypothetical protein